MLKKKKRKSRYFCSLLITRKPSIKHKPLKGDWGQAFAYRTKQPEIELNTSLRRTSQDYMNTLIHESLHCLLPDAEEHIVNKMANRLADTLWKHKYRKVK